MLVALQHVGQCGNDTVVALFLAQVGTGADPGHGLRVLKLVDQFVRTFLELDGLPVAFRYGFLYQGKYYDYQTGFEPTYEKV